MSTDVRAATSPGSATHGLAYWIPELAAALDDDPAGAGARLRSVVAGRSARIALDDDVVLVESVSLGALDVRPDDPAFEPDGSGHTSVDTILAVLDGRLEVDQAIIGGDLEVTSSIDDALWMYLVIELLLDGASRVPRLRQLAADFVAQHRGPRAGHDTTPDDWRTGSRMAEVALLDRLGLLVDQPVDRDG